MFYTEGMSSPLSSEPKRSATFTLKLGHWLEASATGWGVAAVPVVILLLVAAAVLELLLT
jgi:hypothetical protein